jgi:hypothetical protein
MRQRGQLLALVGAVIMAAVGGCAPERPGSVPADARSVAKQSGQNPINFTAPADGTIFVYDRSNQKMVYSGRLRQGDTLEVDSRRNQVRLDGRVINEGKLRDLHEYQVWFDQEPARPVEAAGTQVQIKTEKPAAE